MAARRSPGRCPGDAGRLRAGDRAARGRRARRARPLAPAGRLTDEKLADVPEPYAAQLAGDWERAATQWAAIGRPYEEALALADGDGTARRRALDQLHELGARPAAALVARRLRARGARGLRRGPRRTTRENPANLTPREVEVLGLVEQGLRNKQIAERLFVSAKTVDHHVGAILRKLGVDTRGEAGAAARRLGLAPDDD